MKAYLTLPAGYVRKCRLQPASQECFNHETGSCVKISKPIPTKTGIIIIMQGRVQGAILESHNSSDLLHSSLKSSSQDSVSSQHVVVDVVVAVGGSVVITRSDK